ncbi:MAG: tRNA (adenosine(37)-N6)-dimethylallyltransferase MiaA [Alphaproteobacteria bacterium]|nr:tRNA (adenosine(37)-N6)-dimethylallyltransferase MiaA [Alphaproteobacteria bacterium]
MSLRKIYIVVGPTASGKSALSLQMADTLNGTVVNADSMQIYQDLQILSARPTQADMAGIDHKLYGYVDAYTVNNVQDWVNQAVSVIQETKNPVLVGGTGMYIQALVHGLAVIPDVDLTVRQQVRNMPIEEVKSRVIDCQAVDSQRLRRALEVQLSTGKPLSYFQKQPPRKWIEADFHILFVNPVREVLYQRCNNRFVQMVQTGALDEVQHLLDIKATGGVTKAIGVPEITAYLQQQISYEEMIQKAQTATRHYAKRQITWFRHQLTGVEEINHPEKYVFQK